MSQMLHILRKDLRHLRLPLVVWAGLLVGRALLTILAGWSNDFRAGQPQPLVLSTALIGFLEALMQAVIAARLVHDEPAVGLNAFWLTRPYRRGVLAAAKLTLAALVLVAVPAVRDVAVLAAFGAVPGDLIHAAATTVWNGAVWTLAFAVLAVLTPSFTYFVMTLVGLVVGFLGFMLASETLGAFLGRQVAPGPPGYLADATSPLVAAVLFVVASAAVVRYQYSRRSWWRAAAIAVVSVLVLRSVADRWPWRFARQPAPQVGAWAAGMRAVLAADEIPQATAMNPGRTQTRRVHVNARVDLDSLPGQFQVQSIYTRGRWTSGDGTTIRSEQEGRFSGQMRVGAPPSGRNAVGVAVMPPSSGASYTSAVWPALIALSESEYAAHHDKRGRLDAELDFHLRRSRVVAALPLVGGAAWNGSGVHAEIVDVQPLADGIKLRVRWWKIDSPLEPRYDSYEFVLRNRRRSEAVGPESQPFENVGRGDLPLGLGFSIATPGTVQLRELEFPARWEATPIRVDRDWLAGAELVIVQSTYGGRITKALTADSFQIP